MEEVAPITLCKATLQDAGPIHKMQVEAFAELLQKYKDYEINPGNEPIERIEERIKQPYTDFYLIQRGTKTVGAIRIVKLEEGKKCRISPVFVLPDYQNQGIAQKAMRAAEALYPEAQIWSLQTILEESGNCHLYEKLGYIQTGQPKIINDKMTLVSYQKVVVQSQPENQS